MGNSDLDKKRPRTSGPGTDKESIEAAQDGAYISTNRLIKTYNHRRQH